MVDQQPFRQPTELSELMRSTRVRDLYVAGCPHVSIDESLPVAAERLRSTAHGCVVVVSGERLVGIFTERDWLRVVAHQVEQTLQVEAIMTAPPVTVGIDCPLLVAIQLMAAEHCRRLPVVNQRGAVVGILDVQDVLNYFAELYPHTIFSQAPSMGHDVHHREGA